MILTTLISSTILSWVLCLLLRRIAPGIGLMDDPDDLRKRHRHPTPLVGGIAIWMASTGVLLGMGKSISWPLWIGITAMGGVGLLDDLVELNAFPKLTLQVLVAIFLWWFGIRVTLFISSPMVSLILTILWFVWMTNAINYMDNCNGLCAGVVAFILAGVIWIQIQSGQQRLSPLGMYALVQVGAILGFLFWNFPKGRIFLGDCGSHLLGASVAACIMQTTFVHMAFHESPYAIFAAPFLVFIPWIDFIQVTVGRMRRGQPIWKGDATHLSHLLIQKGYTPAKAVLILWLGTFLSVIVAIGFWRYVL